MSTPVERPRIFSHLTRTRFLHIEDALERGKLRFFIGTFERGQGAGTTAYAFLDVNDARVILSDLAWGKAVDFSDFKGGKDGSGVIISRVLKIHARDNQIWIQVANGPGWAEANGAVKPNGKPSAEISIPLTLFEGRKLAHACLAYLQAWEVVRVSGARSQVSGP